MLALCNSHFQQKKRKSGLSARIPSLDLPSFLWERAILGWGNTKSPTLLSDRMGTPGFLVLGNWSRRGRLMLIGSDVSEIGECEK